uniref:Uncharacterized protein n=1 Tax=Romanomermis culicivorax TaxID=13658 RepID=A0A915HMA8_ROMCU
MGYWLQQPMELKRVHGGNIEPILKQLATSQFCGLGIVGLDVEKVKKAEYLSSIESQAQSDELPIAWDEQNVYDQAYISQYMDAEEMDNKSLSGEEEGRKGNCPACKDYAAKTC